MKKLTALLFVFAILFAACGAKESAPTPTPTATDFPAPQATQTPLAAATLPARSSLPVDESAVRGMEISVWHPWYGIESNIFDSLVKDFNKTNPWKIKVILQGQGNFSNLYENATAALPKAERPNLVIALPEHALKWEAAGVVTDLTPYVSDPVYGMETGDIPALFLAQDEMGGKRVALPAQRNARFLLWNKSWAKKLGFDAAPDTPEDFRQQACRARQSMTGDESPQNDFKGGWLVSTDWMTAYGWMNSFGGGVLEGNDYRFLMPHNIEAFQFLREMAEDGCSWQEANAAPVAAFALREALFITASLEDLPAVARALAEANNTDQWQALPFPGAQRDALVVYGSSYVIFDSDEKENFASWLFIRWLLEEEQDARLVEATHLFPLRASSMNLLGGYQKTHPQWAQVIAAQAEAVTPPQLASWNTVKLMLGDGFTHMYRVHIPSGQVAAILAEMEFTSRELRK